MRQVAGQRDGRGREILGEAAPDLRHVDYLRCLKFATPKSQRGAAKFDLLVLLILCDILTPRPVVLKRAAQATRLRVGTDIGGDIGFGKGFWVLGPPRQEMTQPELLAAVDERLGKIADALKEEEPGGLRARGVHVPDSGIDEVAARVENPSMIRFTSSGVAP